MEEKIIIKIDDDGTMKAETEGFVGTSCATELDKLMKGIATTRHLVKKAEYFQEKVSEDNTQKIKNK